MPDLPAELLRLAQEARDEAGRLERRASQLRETAALLESRAGEVGEALTSVPDDDTLSTMNASPTSDSLRSRARLADDARRHPFVAALVRRNETVSEVAAWLTEKLGRKVPRSTVQAWYKPEGDPHYRAIPADAEKALRARYGLHKSDWPRVID